MSQWQPIETAPKDGRRLLVWDGDDWNVAHWDAEYVHPYTGAVGAWFDSEWLCKFTHWMLPPEPPHGP